MKLNLDESLGAAVTYTQDQRGNCPDPVDKLLGIEGVKSVFVCNDFITLNRDPRYPWQPILAAAADAFAAASEIATDQKREAAEKEGQVAVLVQTFKGIPIQVKIVDTHGEKRIALASRFSEAAQSVQAETGADYLKERYWADWGIRYGPLDVIATEVVAEIEGTQDEAAVGRLKQRALGKEVAGPQVRSRSQLKADLRSGDWCTRLKAVQELGTSADVVSELAGALEDLHPQVRRLAAAALGASGSGAAVEPLCRALIEDQNVGVRRTAGDALSDLGDVSAQQAVCHALSDDNKLVRWRSARFLAEIGTQEALPFLEAAADDPEFEVRLEIRAAIERIAGGSEGLAPAWKRILENGR
jgi:hypothetical protein